MQARLIDMLSDTVTLPTDEMRTAMYNATVGDDVYGEDTTVNRLESMAAALLGKEAACFMPSGTMCNLTAILAQCERGEEILVGDASDLYNYEAGGPSICGGVIFHPIPTQDDGTLALTDLQRAIRDYTDPQFAKTKLVCIENPHNVKGGLVLSLDYLRQVYQFAKENQLALHLDGARVFNAAIALNIPAHEITQYCDTVQFCLSKSLAAPVGSILAGPTAVIHKARRLRKMLGGGMRQAGIIAAAGIVSLEAMIDRLALDHENAKYLATQLATIPGIDCDPQKTHTNMVFFEIKDKRFTIHTFLDALLKNNIRMGELGYNRIRAAVHYGIAKQDIETIIQTCRNLLIQ